MILAQTPPPFHGQSIMVARLVEMLRKPPFSEFLEVQHINLRLSESLSEIGGFSWRKMAATLGYLWQLLRLHRRGGIGMLYYVPATGLRSQLYRDWLLLGIGRRLAGTTFLHWHGLGLRAFYDQRLHPLERALTRWTYGGHEVSLVLDPAHRVEVGWLRPGAVAPAPNFLPDPCASTAGALLRSREQRTARRLAGAPEAPDLEILFLAHCTRSKGLFDAIEAVALANDALKKRGIPWRARLSVGGEFVEAREREEFDRRIAREDLALDAGRPAVRYLGYLEDDRKAETLAKSDVFCLPTYFHTEAQPVSVIEAAAYGLEIVLSDWRSLPSMLPQTSFVVPPRSPQILAESLLASAAAGNGAANRAHFLATYEESVVARQLLAVFKDPSGSGS